ncbi:MAG: hypothetical protein CVV64_16855 [Candidatus Wallbacteria bacterium HGW-Wallbacteria-1]|uniref:Uncharacterized protein n=1 Tax=Candidatus Wallbacteria bacterium HGW-Wallbacteria-1 TaxID=2013854 RepID=A0A2N1PKM7_9BACT|nr:MAG: hypothetical protein CVV64_16855 [Candidatus Wallbacteria bacterium HGW-Wallbacteria-1]
MTPDIKRNWLLFLAFFSLFFTYTIIRDLKSGKTMSGHGQHVRIIDRSSDPKKFWSEIIFMGVMAVSGLIAALLILIYG